MTDSKEPVEPTEQELNRCYWAGHATLSEPDGQRSLLTEVNQITAGRLAIWRSGCETGRAFERLTRERKRGERPNPVEYTGAMAFDGLQVREIATKHFNAGVAWAESGDSDELAALRARVSELDSELAQEAIRRLNEGDALRRKLAAPRIGDTVVVRGSAEEREVAAVVANGFGLRFADGTCHDAAACEVVRRADVAALRAELTERIAGSVTVADHERRAAELHRETDAEKARADRAELRLADSHARVTEQSIGLTQAEARIAELEADLSLTVEGKTEHMLKAGEFERELESVRVHRDTLTRELAEAGSRIAVLEKERTRLEAEADNAGRAAETAEHELAEAREELRLSAPMVAFARNSRWSDAAEAAGLNAMLVSLDAHRAKPSPQSPSGEQQTSVAQAIPCATAIATGAHQGTASDANRVAPNGEGSGHLSYETAPTLEKGVSTEWVKHGDRVMFRGVEYVVKEVTSHCQLWLYGFGEVHVDECERVVRVESAPAPKRDYMCAACNAPLTRAEARGHDCAAQSPPATPEPRRNGSGPLATAAELAERDRRLDRLESCVLAQVTASATELDARAEIRAEREARKL